MTQRIPTEYVEGPDGAVVWLWPNTADPVTVEFDREEWEEIKADMEESEYESMDALIGEAVYNDLAE